jgi:Zn ribbon nucleic-acid-binding protein
MKVKFCPRCKSANLELVAGGNIGMLECTVCKYRGSIFPEKEIKIKNNKKK